MAAKIRFRGPLRYRIRSAALVAKCAAHVAARRAVKGPLCPAWTLPFELGTEILKRQLKAAFRMNIKQGREFLDSTQVFTPALAQVEMTEHSDGCIRGTWFVPRSGEQKLTMLYLHGGGFSLYPKAYANLIAMVTLVTGARTFALDYSLAPEHRFPTQVEDVLKTYRWLLEIGADAGSLLVAGDSAGGNLTLALLLSARDAGLPLPALAIALSPATDFQAEPGPIIAKENLDYLTPEMLIRWSHWYCDPKDHRNPLVSPIYADLRGLPPIYVQAGEAEILYASIRAFADQARKQGADVTLESWPGMNHVFQAFGYEAPQSADALKRIGEVVAAHLPNMERTR